jgi:RNA polymerase sigma factor (sigma-70 family)
MRDDRSVTALVMAAREGEKAAWNEIVQRYAALVWSVCRRHRLSGDDADDVVQNVWLLLVRHLPDLREPAALPGWIATTTRRECLRMLRSRTHELDGGFDPGADPDEPSVEELVLRKERQAALLVALERLPADCRRLLLLLTEDPPLPYAEIAARLGMTVGGIGPRRGRCLDRLRRSPTLARLIDHTRAPSPGGDGHDR